MRDAKQSSKPGEALIEQAFGELFGVATGKPGSDFKQKPADIAEISLKEAFDSPWISPERPSLLARFASGTGDILFSTAEANSPADSPSLPPKHSNATPQRQGDKNVGRQ